MAEQVESAQGGAPSASASPAVQENMGARVSEETNAQPTSEAQAGEGQEHPTSEAPKPTPQSFDELPDDIKQLAYRQAQSMKDRELARERARWEQELTARAQAEEEKRRLEMMDDAEYGEHVRRQQMAQEKEQQVLYQERAKIFSVIEQAALSTISNEETRDEVAQRAREGAYKTPQEFLAACSKAEQEIQVAKVRAKLEKEIREAVLKEQTAEETESGPVVGVGTPTSSLAGMSTEELLRRGVAEAFEKRRRGH